MTSTFEKRRNLDTQRDGRDVSTDKRPPEDTTGRSHLQDKERGSRETTPVDTLILGFQTLELRYNIFLLFKPLTLPYFVCKLMQDSKADNNIRVSNK